MNNLIGHSLGRYHILEQLGEGGMAIVYKAYDTRLEADVAVKIIRTDSLPPNALERTLKRFEREARALARLTHPNIVKVMDYGEHEGKPYLVMPLLSGGTLKSKLNGKPMLWQDAMRILIPIADALGYAHNHDIIHRDVKPANILITENGQPMLADFGVAKMLDIEETMELTGTGVGLGTPEYMAPEQVTNKLVDARVDIYALGVVLFEMVTGRKPYIADTPMAVLIMHSRDPLPRPRSFAPNLPQEVENLLLKALAKNPKDRYQNMVEFLKAMERVSSGKKFGDSKAIEISTHGKRAEFKFPVLSRRTAIIVVLIALGIGLIAIFSSSLKSLPATFFPNTTITKTPMPLLTDTIMFTSTATRTVIPTQTASITPTLVYIEGKTLFEENFENNGISNLDAKTFPETGNPKEYWTIQQGQDGNHYLIGAPPMTFESWFDIGSESWKNYVVQLRANVQNAETGGGRGLEVTFRNELGECGNGFVLGVGKFSYLVQSHYKKCGGVSLSNPNVSRVVFGQWFTIRIEAYGPEMRIHLDDQLIYNFTNDAPLNGGVSIGTGTGVTVFFDDIHIVELIPR